MGNLTFPDSQVTAQLRAAKSAVVHAVGATNLAATLPKEYGAKFDRVIFQFPQHPDRKKIHKHRDLLRGFFSSAASFLQSGGEVVVSLHAGQGGSPAEVKQKTKSDTWQIQDIAAEHGFIMRAVERCPISSLFALGYTCTGRRNIGQRSCNSELRQDKEFNLEGSLTHRFCLDHTGISACYPLCWAHDVSFWVADSFTDEILREKLEETCGAGCTLGLTCLDEFSCPTSG